MLLLTNKWYNFVYHFQSHVIKEAIEGYYKSDFFFWGGGVGIQKIKLVVLAMLLYKLRFDLFVES